MVSVAAKTDARNLLTVIDTRYKRVSRSNAFCLLIWW